MDIETLEKIKKAASEALSGRKKLEKLHDNYFSKLKNGGFTRAQTTTYNARTAQIVEHIVEPNERIIRLMSSQ